MATRQRESHGFSSIALSPCYTPPPMFRARRITLYLLSELGLATLAGIAVWTAILLMNDFFFIARQAIQKDLGLDVTVQLLALKVPSLLVLAIPMGTLLGSLVAVGRLSADGEVTALQASGLGPAQLLWPMALHGLLALTLAASVYVFIQPWASYEARSMQGRILTARNISTELRPRVFFDKIPGYVLFVDEIPPGTQGILQHALLFQAAPLNSKGPDQLIVAKEATLGPDAGGRGRLRIVFRGGVAQSFRTADPDSYRSFQFDTFSPEPIEPPPWMLPTDARPDKTVADMTPSELWRELREARTDPDKLLRGYRVRWAETEIHRRVALPVLSLLFAVLALPLGVSRVRSGKGAGFALSLGIVLIYYVIFTVGLDQAKEGRIPPAVGIWAANAVIFVWAVVAIVRMRAASGVSWWTPLLARAAAAGTWLVRSIRRRPPESPARPASIATTERRPSAIRLSAILDRYIGVLYLRMLALALASTYLVFTLLELKGLIDSVLERKQPAILVLTYFKYFFPGILVLTLPFAAMIAAVVSVTVLSRTGEVTALKAAGMSARRICVPILLITVLLCAILHLVQDRIAPETNRRAQAVKDQIQGRNPRTYGWTPGGRWTFGTQGRLYHYRLFDPQSLRFQGLSVFRVNLAQGTIDAQWFCASARWNGQSWDGDKGWYRSFPEPGAAGEYHRFEHESLAAFDPPGSFTRQERTFVTSDLPEQTSLEELSDQIADLAKSGYDTTRLRVEFWQKTSSVAMPLVTVLLGLPFAFKVGRRGSMYGVGVGLILAIVFWAAAAISNALGLETILTPFLSAWTPNVIFAVIGGYLLLFIPT